MILSHNTESSKFNTRGKSYGWYWTCPSVLYVNNPQKKIKKSEFKHGACQSTSNCSDLPSISREKTIRIEKLCRFIKCFYSPCQCSPALYLQSNRKDDGVLLINMMRYIELSVCYITVTCNYRCSSHRINSVNLDFARIVNNYNL